jgi:protein gp37
MAYCPFNIADGVYKKGNNNAFKNKDPLDFIKKVFAVMNDNPQHVFQVLTKRADRLFELHQELKWTHNIWMGVSVENDKVRYRIDLLRNTKVKVKFLSLEPLIGPLYDLDLSDID